MLVEAEVVVLDIAKILGDTPLLLLIWIDGHYLDADFRALLRSMSF
jgi:hypothetical protein